MDDPPRLPQPFRCIAKVIESVFEDAWRAIERKKQERGVLHPEQTRKVCDESILFVWPIGHASYLVATETTLFLINGEDSKELSIPGMSHVSNVAEGIVACGCQGESVSLVSFNDWKILRTFDENAENGVRLSPDATILCVYGPDSTKVIDASAGSTVREIEGAARIDFTLQDTMLCYHVDQTACRKYSLKISDDDQQPVAEWLMPAPVSCSAIDQHGVAAIGLRSGLTVLWDLKWNLFCHILPRRHRSSTSSIAFQGQEYLVTAGADASLHLYALKGAHHPPELIFAHKANAVSIESRVDVFAFGGIGAHVTEDAVVVYDLDTGLALKDLTSPTKTKKLTAYGCDNDSFVFATDDGCIAFYSGPYIRDALFPNKIQSSSLEREEEKQVVFDAQVLVEIAIREAHKNRTRREEEFSEAMRSFASRLKPQL